MTFVADIHVLLRMNYNNFNDRLMFPQNISLSNTLVFSHQPLLYILWGYFTNVSMLTH